MLNLKQFIEESKLPTPEPSTQKSFEDVSKAIGKARTNALQKHKWMGDYHGFEKAYKHGVNRSQSHEVEVYPYMKAHHTTSDGNIRPTTMLRFHFSDSGKVMQAHKFMRDKEPSEQERSNPGTGWRHVTSWKKQEHD
jgi:hypothetical protein